MFLRWAIHLNVTVIPRSRDPRHILLNFKALDIELSKEEIKIITEEWLPSSNREDNEAGQESKNLETSEPGDQETEENDGNDNHAEAENDGNDNHAEEENDGNDNHVTSDGSKDEL
jgi:hypothetical protein